MDDATYRLTTIDGLTGVHNKRFFMEFLEREMASCLRHGRPLSLLLFDIDHLAKINEKHGLIPGDVVLKEVARRVSGRMRQADLLARYGGEEFAVVLPETSRSGALELAEQIRKLVADDPVSYEGETIPVTVSLGIAVLEGVKLDPAAFIKLADDKLHEAKLAGRNRVGG